MLNIPRYKIAFLFFDMMIISIGIIIANYSVLNNSGLSASDQLYNSIELLFKLILYSSLILFVFRNSDLYKINVILNRKLHLQKLAAGLIKLLFVTLFVLILINIFIDKNLIDCVLNLVLLSISLLLLRIYLFTNLYRLLSRKLLRNNILLVGTGNFSKIISAEYLINNSLPINIIGILFDKNNEKNEFISGINYLGSISKLNEIVRSKKIDEIIISFEDNDYSTILEKLDELDDLDICIRLASEKFEIINEKISPETYYEVPLLSIHSSKPSKKLKRFLLYKRIFDLFFASIGIIILSPLYLITFLIIRLTSKGPAIYAQERVGMCGKTFKFYKFRSMTIDESDDIKRKNDMIKFIKTNQEGNDEFKVINESRLTKVGKLIRKTSIDELPQLFNVIKGDMSLVGPRPCLPYEYENYKLWQKRRLQVLPGCTGFWQIFGRNKVSFLDSTIMDIYYTYVMSPINDIEYIIKTLPAMIFAKGK